MWDLSFPIEPTPLELEGEVLTTGLPRKSPVVVVVFLIYMTIEELYESFMSGFFFFFSVTFQCIAIAGSFHQISSHSIFTIYSIFTILLYFLYY